MPGINFRQASGRPQRWDLMTWLHSEIDRRRLPPTTASARDILWRAREVEQSERNRFRLQAWRTRNAERAA